MKDLKDLEKKYAELGREIEALKNEQKYPIYCLSKGTEEIVRFTGLQEGIVVKQGDLDDVGYDYNKWVAHTNTNVWQQLDVCPKTGFYDGQLVWCWDDNYTHERRLKFYDTKKETTFYYNGERCGIYYHKYEPYEGNWPEWALEAFKTLEK